MTIGIYSITHSESGKRYIGKSINIEQRFITHKHLLKSDVYKPKHVNRYLFNAVKKYGIDNFKMEIIEVINTVDEEFIANRELFWMDFYGTTDPDKGFNLRRDSSTGMIVHEKTRELQSLKKGVLNPNYGNKWSDDQKKRMSEIAKARHKTGLFYTQEWKNKQSIKFRNFWKNNPEIKKVMAKKVSEKTTRYKILQLDRNDNLIREWESVKNVIENNPGYKWQNIYSVCGGYKKTYMGFKWVKVLK